MSEQKVTSGDKAVGYITPPSQPGGKWHCWVYKPGGGARHVGWASDDIAAREKVRRMAS